MTKKSQQNLIEMVKLLADGECHDGNSLGKKLEITRSAVWKIIEKLKNYNIKINSVKGKGYALRESLILFDLKKIRTNCLNKKIDIILLESVDSTNTYLKNIKNIKHPKICITEHQTKGKGRFNREWYSPFARNIYLSCLYPFQKDISELAGLSLMTSLAVLKTLKNAGIKENLFVKWSNDIVYGTQKISGNLIEIQAETNATSQAVIGIGINVNMVDEDQNPISQEWTSMLQILNRYTDRNTLCSSLINYLMSYLKRFEEEGFCTFMKEWADSDSLVNKMITLRSINESTTGRVLGINELGHLLLELPNGSVRTFSSGETSVIGLG